MYKEIFFIPRHDLQQYLFMYLSNSPLQYPCDAQAKQWTFWLSQTAGRVIGPSVWCSVGIGGGVGGARVGERP